MGDLVSKGERPARAGEVPSVEQDPLIIKGEPKKLRAQLTVLDDDPEPPRNGVDVERCETSRAQFSDYLIDFRSQARREVSAHHKPDPSPSSSSGWALFAAPARGDLLPAAATALINSTAAFSELGADADAAAAAVRSMRPCRSAAGQFSSVACKSKTAAK